MSMSQSNRQKTKFLDSSCGDQGDHKILVAYASGYGTTGKVAEIIGQTFCEGGATVDIKWINNIKDLKAYDAVIIGSAIQFDRWMPEARQFVTNHQKALSKLPVAFFFTCLTLSRQTKETEQQASTYANKLYALYTQGKPISVGRFAGVLDYSKISLIARPIFKILYSIIGVKEGDYRDWRMIKTWAKVVHTEIEVILAKNESSKV